MKEQNVIALNEVIATATTDIIDVSKYTDALVQISLDLVDVNTNLTLPTIQITAETSVDKVNWFDVDYDSTELVATTAATLASTLGVTTNKLGLYLRFTVTVGGTGYELEAVDPDDNAYWDNIKIITTLFA